MPFFRAVVGEADGNEAPSGEAGAATPRAAP
jgi:hypothetical protein